MNVFNLFHIFVVVLLFISRSLSLSCDYLSCTVSVLDDIYIYIFFRSIFITYFFLGWWILGSFFFSLFTWNRSDCGALCMLWNLCEFISFSFCRSLASIFDWHSLPLAHSTLEEVHTTFVWIFFLSTKKKIELFYVVTSIYLEFLIHTLYMNFTDALAHKIKYNIFFLSWNFFFYVDFHWLKCSWAGFVYVWLLAAFVMLPFNVHTHLSQCSHRFHIFRRRRERHISH